MLNVTNAARARLSEMLAKHPEDVAVRIVFRNGRTRLKRGSVRPGDEVFQRQGRIVLALTESVAGRLENRTLDLHDTDEGRRLRLRKRPTD